MRTFRIFDNKVEVRLDSRLVEQYEAYCCPLKDMYLEQLAYASDLTEEDSIEHIEKELALAVQEEIEVMLEIMDQYDNR